MEPRNSTTPFHHHKDPVGVVPFVLLFTVVASFFIWCCCVGVWLARLWYYDGQLHQKFQKYDIQPLYIRERLAAEREHQRRENQRIVETARWSRDVTTMSFEGVLAIQNPDLRQRIFENKRISRLPAFEQDDGGDGSEFPDMPVDMTAEAFNREYFPKRYDNYRDLGLEKLDRQPRLTYDDEEQMIAREHIFEDFREACIQWRPGKEAEDACGELWMEVARYLCTQYPQRFRERKEKGTRKLLDHDTGEIYPLEGPFGWLTLDTITRLVREDFCIFKKSPFSAQHTLLAGAVCFPSGWRLRSRVGLSVDSQQEAVLSWEKLPEILAYMDENGDSDTYERNVTFVQTVRQEEPDFTKKYFIQECKDFFSGNVGTLFQPKTLHGRFERQMFTKLSKTGAIVLTTRVQVHPLAEIEEADLVAFAEDVRSWPAHVARLKGRDLWGSVVLNYIDEVTGRV